MKASSASGSPEAVVSVSERCLDMRAQGGLYSSTINTTPPSNTSVVPRGSLEKSATPEMLRFTATSPAESGALRLSSSDTWSRSS